MVLAKETEDWVAVRLLTQVSDISCLARKVMNSQVGVVAGTAGRVCPSVPQTEAGSPRGGPLRTTHPATRTARIVNVMRPFSHRPELFLFALAIAALNALSLPGACSSALVFQQDAVRAGEWWRLFTHPFVHVTWYHLFLDGSAFLMLYHSLQEPRLGCRLLYVLGGAIGSLIFSWNSSAGLCGLSGIAHGLMAVSALEMISNSPHSPDRSVALMSFSLVVCKAGLEAVSGHMFFAFLDFGMLGTPCR